MTNIAEAIERARHFIIGATKGTWVPSNFQVEQIFKYAVASAPQEPDDARDIQLLIEYAVNADPPIPVNLERWRFAEQVLQRLFAQGRIAASLKVQEPVADDDALLTSLKAELEDRDREHFANHGIVLSSFSVPRSAMMALFAMLDRLQAKAPETPYCGIVRVAEDEAPETDRG